MEPDIQIVKGKSEGIVKAYADGWEGIAYKISRDEVETCKGIRELEGPGAYILFSKDGTGSDCAYTGKAREMAKRIHDHNTKGEEWYECVAFVSKLPIYASHASYLENKIFLAAMLGRYKKANNNLPEGELLRQEDIVLMEKYMQPINVILKKFGHDVIEPIWTDREGALADEEKKYGTPSYYFKHPSGRPYAIGKDVPEGFMVLKGSLNSYRVANSAPFRKELEGNGKIDPLTTTFTESVLFKDKASAATVVWGMKTSGSQWKKDVE